jgi:hypothetical protein
VSQFHIARFERVTVGRLGRPSTSQLAMPFEFDKYLTTGPRLKGDLSPAQRRHRKSQRNVRGRRRSARLDEGIFRTEFLYSTAPMVFRSNPWDRTSGYWIIDIISCNCKLG